MKPLKHTPRYACSEVSCNGVSGTDSHKSMHRIAAVHSDQLSMSCCREVAKLWLLGPVAPCPGHGTEAALYALVHKVSLEKSEEVGLLLNSPRRHRCLNVTLFSYICKNYCYFVVGLFCQWIHSFLNGTELTYSLKDQEWICTGSILSPSCIILNCTALGTVEPCLQPNPNQGEKKRDQCCLLSAAFWLVDRSVGWQMQVCR